MKFKTETISPDLRAEIEAAIANLAKFIKRGQQNGKRALKLSDDLAKLEEEHIVLSKATTLSRTQASDLNAIVTQKASVASALATAEQELGDERQTLFRINGGYENLLMRLMHLAHEQVAQEVETVLSPYFLPGSHALHSAARTNDFLQNLAGHFRRPISGFPATLNEAVAASKTIQTILEDILADREFFTLEPALEKAA